MSVSPRLGSRLLRWLLLPLVSILALSVLVDAFLTRKPVTEAFDQRLAVMALAIAQEVVLEADYPVLRLPPEAEQVLRSVGGEDFRFAVFDATGHRFGGTGALPPLPLAGRGRPVFFEGTHEGVTLRCVTLDARVGDQTVRIAVGVPRARLDRRLEEAIAPGLTSDIVLILLTLVLVYAGVRRGLMPLERLQAEIAARSPTDLSPLPTADLPAELLGLADTLNRLFVALREAEAVQQRFIADAAHQLRTPLAGLQTQLQLLSLRPERRLGAQERRDLQNGLERISHLLGQLLVLARAEPGAAASLRAQPLDLAELVTDCAGPFVDRALERGIDLGYETAPTHVEGVRSLLIEAISNLIDNALRYCPRGSTVTVRCGASPQPWLEVEDDGPGIPEAERERVFERFYRLHDDDGDGCGLGLPIVREVVQRHGARVELLDGPGGKGLRVRLEFISPVSPDAAARPLVG